LLYILYGEDGFSRTEALQRIKSEAGDSDFLDSNTVILDGKQLTSAQMKAVCDAAPFFTSHRLVIVENLLARFEAKPIRASVKDSRRNESNGREYLLQELVDYVKVMPRSTILILVDGTVRPTNPLLKRLSPLGTVLHFPSLRGKSLYAWIQARVSARGGKISPPAARLLGDLVGDDLWTLHNEIEKLLLFAPGPVIGESDIAETVSYAREANMFAMMDAIMARRTDLAQSIVCQLFDEGMKAPQLTAFLIRQLRLILRAREALREGLKRQDIRSRLEIVSDYALDKIVEQARRHSTDGLREAYARVLDADLAVKRGVMKDELALNLLVADLCSS
jgi:DNA polymerase-3 subunit delta